MSVYLDDEEKEIFSSGVRFFGPWGAVVTSATIFRPAFSITTEGSELSCKILDSSKNVCNVDSIIYPNMYRFWKDGDYVEHPEYIWTYPIEVYGTDDDLKLDGRSIYSNSANRFFSYTNIDRYFKEKYEIDFRTWKSEFRTETEWGGGWSWNNPKATELAGKSDDDYTNRNKVLNDNKNVSLTHFCDTASGPSCQFMEITGHDMSTTKVGARIILSGSNDGFFDNSANFVFIGVKGCGNLSEDIVHKNKGPVTGLSSGADLRCDYHEAGEFKKLGNNCWYIDIKDFIVPETVTFEIDSNGTTSSFNKAWAYNREDKQDHETAFLSAPLIGTLTANYSYTDTNGQVHSYEMKSNFNTSNYRIVYYDYYFYS